MLEKHQEQAERNMDIIQDAVAIDQEIEYNQQAMQDLMNQQTGKMQEGLEDEFDQLGEDELMDAMGGYEAEQKQGQKEPVQAQKAKKDTSYDDMMKDLLA